MQQRKDRPILFEVVNKPPPSRPVGGGRLSIAGLTDLARRMRTRSEPPPEQPEPIVANPPVAPPEPQGEPDAVAVIPGWLTERKLTLAMSWTGVAAVGVLAVLLIILAFHVGGRWSRGGQPTRDPAEDVIDRKLHEEPQPAVLEIPDSQKRSGGRIATPARAEPRPAVADAPPRPVNTAPVVEAPAEPAREKGKHYVVIQHFRKTNRNEADAAARFVQTSGIPCAVFTSPADIRLIATQGFLLEQKDAPAKQAEQKKCDDLQRKIKELGKQYAKLGHYMFDQCYADKY